MAAPSRFPSGVGNRESDHPLGMMPVFDPAKNYIWFDDFDRFTIAAAGVTGWVLTEVNTGAPPVVQDLLGGVIKLVLDNADPAATAASVQDEADTAIASYNDRVAG